MASCIWTGKSGTRYTYEIHEMNSNWKDVPGNYIFAKETSTNRWTAVYIGQTESFKTRLPNHEKLPCIRRNSGTHIHAHVNADSSSRLDEESDLRASDPTPCNDQ